MKQGTAYDEHFYATQQGGSVRSAEVIIPAFLELFPARSVIDVGCGVGGWLKEFERCGVNDYLGVDGDYVSEDTLLIPPDRFMAADLATFTPPERRFDVACSLEVAEHLPADAAKSFVSVLTGLAPVILFSAAVPGQGGTNHINEQWQSYWAALFDARGFVCLDCIRPIIYRDDRIEWWYRQNILVFCEPSKVPAHLNAVTSTYDLDRIHPGLLALALGPPHSGRAAVQSLLRDVRVIAEAVLRKMGKRRLS